MVGNANIPALDPSSYDVVLSRHVLWATTDPQAALRRWVDLLVPGGVLVLVEGRWHAGAGIPSENCAALVHRLGRTAVVRELPEPVLWGGETDDERYLLMSRG